MEPSTALIDSAFKYNLNTLERNLEGVSDEMALFAGDGRPHSSVNWVLGHLLVSRNRVHGLLGLEPVLSDEVAAAYAYGTKPNDAPPLRASEQFELLRASTERIAAALEAIDPTELARELERGTVGERLWFLSWHETYHAGQFGVLRRLLGLGGAI